MKKISIVTPCYNEEPNVFAVYSRIKEEFEKLSDSYCYEHIFIDNCSTDGTVAELRKIAAADKNVKVILNAMNFGHIRSPFYGLCQAEGDAVMLIVADLQDPPELIPSFIEKWEQGSHVVIGVKTESRENPLMFQCRKLYYKLIKAMSETRQIENFTGFGLYDKSFVQLMRSIDDPYPYMRGLVAEYGGDIATIQYLQPKRAGGKTHNNFYTLYDMAMLGFTSHTKVPVRLAAFSGAGICAVTLTAMLIMLILSFAGVSTVAISSILLHSAEFFLGGLILLFTGVVGEYTAGILTQVKHRPLVIEKERINYD